MPQKRSKNTNAELFDKVWGAFIDNNSEQEPPVGAICSHDLCDRSKGRITLDSARCILERRARTGELTEIKVRRKRGGRLSDVRYYLPVLK